MTDEEGKETVASLDDIHADNLKIIALTYYPWFFSHNTKRPLREVTVNCIFWSAPLHHGAYKVNIGSDLVFNSLVVF